MVESVCDLGYFLDNQLKNGVHINKVTKICFHLLRKIQKIWSHLTQDTAHIIVQSLIISRLNYCNSLLLGSANYQLDKYQRIQNMACRVVVNLKKFDHKTPSMKELHWLRICDRIIFKIALLVYKCRCGNVPKYLMDFLKTNKPSRQLRSSYNTTLQPKFYRNELPKSTSFSSASPRIWNDLPLNVRTATTNDNFKSLLKTHLFTNNYG